MYLYSCWLYSIWPHIVWLKMMTCPILWHHTFWLHNYLTVKYFINTLRPGQNGRHFTDILLNENVWIPNEISLKFVSKGPINNIPSLVQIMAWRRPGDKPLSEPMMVSLLAHICVTRPQWVNTSSLIIQLIKQCLDVISQSWITTTCRKKIGGTLGTICNSVFKPV